MARSNKFFHPHRHVGYSAKYSAEKNVMEGRHKGLSYLTIGKELEALATVQKRHPENSRSFRRAADLAYRLHAEGRR